MMYGSTKEGGQVYRLTHIYDNDTERIDHYTYDSDELVSRMAIRFFTEDDKLTFKNEFEDNEEFMDLVREAKDKYGESDKKKKKK